MYKVDFHTHSSTSKDGGITKSQFRNILTNGTLDLVAITDHDAIDLAIELQRELGEEKVIIGEEISTSQGEIVGLYLTSRINPGMSAKDTVQAIKNQGGIVYIPHPFETIRSGIPQPVLDEIADSVDIVEGCNGRAMAQNFGPQATVWARQNNKAVAASSDAHGVKGLGHTYTELHSLPNKDTLVELLSTARLRHSRPPLYTLLYPKLNRLKNIFRSRK